MKHDFNEVIDRKGTISLKWENLSKTLPGASDDALPLWVADMDFACAPKILEALHKRIDRKIFGYTYGFDEKYIDSVTSWYKRRFNWNVNRESIVYSPGVIPALAFLFNILTDEGNGIIIQCPVYYPFTKKILANNRKLINNSLSYKDGKYTINYEDLENKLKDDNNKILLFCNPHNPVGRVWTEEELKKVINLCKKYNKYIISDEIHFDLIRKKYTHNVLETVDPDYKNKIFTCTAPSKTFNLAGIQNSNIIIHDEKIREKYIGLSYGKFGIECPNTFAMTATTVAYDECEDWLDELNEYIDANIEYVREFIKNNMPKAKYIECQGTYLVWIDMKEYGYTDEELNNLILKDAKVALDGGSMFGEEGNYFQRINVACPRSILIDCMNKIKNVLNK